MSMCTGMANKDRSYHECEAQLALPRLISILSLQNQRFSGFVWTFTSSPIRSLMRERRFQKNIYGLAMAGHGHGNASRGPLALKHPREERRGESPEIDGHTSNTPPVGCGPHPPSFLPITVPDMGIYFQSPVLTLEGRNRRKQTR